MGVRRGGQEGALAPLAGQYSMFFNFYERKYYDFAPPPWKILPSPGKKSADAYAYISNLL